MSADSAGSVREQIVAFLAYGATPVSSVEGFFQGDDKRSVRDVIQAHPNLFELFTRGYPESGPKVLWVRLKRADAP